MLTPLQRHSRWRHTPRYLSLLVLLGAITISLFPLWDRWQAARENRRLLARAAQATAQQVVLQVPLKYQPAQPSLLASWGNVGGCGVGGGGGATGGVKWVGRGVSGGLVDIQCLSNHNFILEGGYRTSLSTRFATSPFDKWMFAANTPFMLNIEDVDAHGTDQTAYLPGVGDIGVEITRKLGMTNASSLTLSLNFPTGSHDSVRHGVVLPQQMQLGAGTMSGGLTYEYTQDHDWGLMIYGLSLAYGGWENDMGDVRASSGSGYLHAGYIIGPFVPSAGVNFMTKFWGDRERTFLLDDQPMAIATLNLGLEWSSDWLAVLLSGTAPLTINGLESWGFAVGIQTSVF